MNAFKKYSRRDFLQYVGAAAMSISLGSILADGSRLNRPNIVLVVADDWAHTNLGRTPVNLMLAFRSSPYGSVNHAHADQNTFNILIVGPNHR